MKVQNITSGYAFSRNPIVVHENYAAGLFDRRGGKLTVRRDGTVVYVARFFPPLDIDVSEIVDAFVDNLPEPEDHTEPIFDVCDSDAMSSYNCNISAEYDSYESECELTVIPGGISKQNFRRLAALQTDIFESRFLSYKGNFFLTTRTAGWQVIMKETELYPLYFFTTQNLEIVEVVDKIKGGAMTYDELTPGLHALDIDLMRRKFMETYKVIPSVFDVYMAGVFSCRIVVERSSALADRHRLKFRNSLGVFEIIEITGRLTVAPEYESADDAAYKRYDSLSRDFNLKRGRIERRQVMSIDTGVKRPDELRFMMDMLGSDDVWLLDFGDFPIKVIPSIDDFTYSPRPLAPEKFTLKLTVAESETYIMEDIADDTASQKPSVFSDQFSKHFN